MAFKVINQINTIEAMESSTRPKCDSFIEKWSGLVLGLPQLEIVK